MQDVYILGAGFSKAICEQMPVLSEFGQHFQQSDPGPIREAFENQSRYATELSRNVELLLTYLSQQKPWLTEAENLRDRALFLELSRGIAGFLNCRTAESLRQLGDCPRWLNHLVGAWHGNRSTVISFNYDTLVETVAGDFTCQGKKVKIGCGRLYPVPLSPANLRNAGPFGEPMQHTFTLVKLHGSVNWFYSGRPNFAGETIYYVKTMEGMHAVFEGDSAICYQMASVVDKVPLIIPPTLEKSMISQHETLSTLWLRASQALKQADRIFCLGYSLPESDLPVRFLLSGLAPSKASFEIVNLENRCDHFAKLLPKSLNVTQRFEGPGAVLDFCKAQLGLSS